MDRDFGRDLAVALGGMLPIVVGIAMLAVRGEVDSAVTALVLMATVVIAATFGERRAAVVPAITATLTFDFFHVRPYGTLTMDSANDVETAIVLLVTGLIVGSVAARRRRTQHSLTRQVARGEAEVRRLHRVADLIAHGATEAEILFAAERELTELLDLVSCSFSDEEADSDVPVLERNGTITGGELRFVGSDFALPRAGVSLPVFHQGHRIGTFLLHPNADAGVSLEQRIVALAIADQAGAALVPLA
jgi:K+-sensing histidine kinase KdpD